MSVSAGEGRAEEAEFARAEVYVEAAERPVAGGRWLILPGDKVVYERPGGEVVRSGVVLTAETLRRNPSWRKAWAE